MGGVGIQSVTLLLQINQLMFWLQNRPGNIATDFLSRTYPQKSDAAGAMGTWLASERYHFNVDEDFLFKYFLQAPYKSTALISKCFRMLAPC